MLFQGSLFYTIRNILEGNDNYDKNNIEKFMKNIQ